MYERQLFDIYLTDVLYYMGKNQTLTTRYADLLPREDKNSSRSGDEIAANFLKNWKGGIK